MYIGEAVHLLSSGLDINTSLYEDGLYVDSGIVNLQNTFVAPMAFSDARLVMPLSLRVVSRANIIVDANDDRHFKLLLIENAIEVPESDQEDAGPSCREG